MHKRPRRKRTKDGPQKTERVMGNHESTQQIGDKVVFETPSVQQHRQAKVQAEIAYHAAACRALTPGDQCEAVAGGEGRESYVPLAEETADVDVP